jgi:uncharacterized membrane protein HdeD (DUF308 family)
MFEDLARTITDKWWTFLVRGILALILGFAVFAYPVAAAGVLVYIVAAYFVATGLAQIAGGIATSGGGQWWLLILSGALSVFLGFMMVMQPGMGPLALAYMVAFYATLTGVTEISSGVMLKDVVPHTGWWIALGIVSLIVGMSIIVYPALGVATLVYTVGFYAIAAAVMQLGFAFRLKSAGNRFAKHAHA